MVTVQVTVTHGGGPEFHVNVSPNEAELAIVRAEFNPSGNDDVMVLKILGATLIRAANELGKDGRLTALARTAAEEATMWAVKSATKE